MAGSATEIEIATHLAGVWEAARVRWPSVVIDQTAFVAYASRHATQQVALDRWSAVELYLTCAVLSADPHAVAAFEVEYFRPLDRALARFCDPGLIEDAKQVLRVRLLVRNEDGDPPRIATFTGRGPLGKWLEVAAVRTAVSLRRKDRDVPIEDHALAALQGVGADPKLVHLQQTYLAEFTKAWRAGLSELEPRDRTLLRLHLLDRLSVETLGALYGVHATTAARWLRQVRERLADRVREHMRSGLHVSSAELESIVAMIHSQMDVTLGGLLSEDTGLRESRPDDR